MERESIQVTRSVAIPRSEIELRFSRSSGPGGQHAQKTRDARRGDLRRRGLVGAHARRRSGGCSRGPGPVLRAVAQDERSQWRNRELATERLVEALRDALRVPRRRRPTKPSRAAVERRLEQKRRRSEVKRRRRELD